MFTHALLSAASCMKKTVTVGSSPERQSASNQEDLCSGELPTVTVLEKMQSVQTASPKEEK